MGKAEWSLLQYRRILWYWMGRSAYTSGEFPWNKSAMPDRFPNLRKSLHETRFRQIWYYRNARRTWRYFRKPEDTAIKVSILSIEPMPTFRLREHLITSQEQSHPISQILLKISNSSEMPAILSRKKWKTKPLPNFPFRWRTDFCMEDTPWWPEAFSAALLCTAQ